MNHLLSYPSPFHPCSDQLVVGIMVVKMMKWSPWPQPVEVAASKKFRVKVKPIKLQGHNVNIEHEDNNAKNKVVIMEMIWKSPPKVGLPSLRKTHKRSSSLPKNLRPGFDVEWDDEFETVCSFSNPSYVSFNLLYGQNGERKSKFMLLGSVSMNIGELASEDMESEIERKLPVALQVAGSGGVASHATLLISVRFEEIRIGSGEAKQEMSESEKQEGLIRKMKRLTSRKKKKKKTEGENSEDHNDEKGSSSPSDTGTSFDSYDFSTENFDWGPAQQAQEPFSSAKEGELASNNHSDKEPSGVSQLQSSTSSETRSDSSPKLGFWKKRRLSFKPSKTKDGSKMSNSDDNSVTKKANQPALENSSSGSDRELATGSWEEKELISRDGHSKLKTNVFLASIDQRSGKASGESACTVLVTIIANWLQSYKDQMPTKSQFDSLIMEGSYEWRKLCENQTYSQRFPDKHFDLETVLEANLRPVTISYSKSFIGFFCPEKFESLKGAMSFEEIWDSIGRNRTQDGEPHIYIVSWNDHFFVMKVENGTYYIIDTLGERLYEGCNQAYILKFDDTSEMYKVPEKVETKDNKDENRTSTSTSDSKTEKTEEAIEEEMVCKGKECCLEFFNRYLAAIPLRELEMEEEKGTSSSSIPLHQRLQIEFHYSSSSCTLLSS